MNFIDLKSGYAKIADDVQARIQAVLEHGAYINGPEVTELEQRIAEKTGAKHVIGCASGTDACLMLMLAYGVAPGDEVITPAFSFAAVVEMCLLICAKPVLVDVEPDTCLMDPAKLEAAITSKTKLIIPVSLYGQCADMDAICEIADRHNVPVCEDAAQSFGATYHGRQSGHLSHSALFSFYPSKPLGAYGDAGACLTDNDVLAERLRAIRVHGDYGRYTHKLIGITGRIDSLQAAILLAKIEVFDEEAEARIRIGEAYTQKIQALNLPTEQLRTLVVYPHNTSMYAQYTICVQDRDALRAHLQEQGIPTAVHYPTPLHQQVAYQGRVQIPEDGLPVSEMLAASVVSLPMHPYLEASEQDRVVACLAS